MGRANPSPPLSLFTPNLKKRMITIVEVTRKEADFIQKQFPEVTATPRTRHGKVYLEEAPGAMQLLRKIRDGEYIVK